MLLVYRRLGAERVLPATHLSGRGDPLAPRGHYALARHGQNDSHQ